jgi:hypothetical protein
VIDTFTLEDIVMLNAIDTRLFLPFVIYRLHPLVVEGEANLDLTLLNVLEIPVVTRQLQLVWQPESEELLVPPVQEHVITEWAACGIACIVVPLYTDFQVLQVTQSGDGFDYWVGNETQELGLEVSGTLDEDVRQRHRAKVQQFRRNPLKVAGYVSVTGFRAGNSIFSFHRSVDQKDEVNE